MVGGGAAGDPLVMVADVGRVGGNMGNAGRFPKGDLAPPIVFTSGAGRDPDLDPDFGWIAPGFPRQPAQFLERGERLFSRRIAQRHKPVAISGGAAEGRLGVAAIPDRHPPDSGRGLIPASSMR